MLIAFGDGVVLQHLEKAWPSCCGRMLVEWWPVAGGRFVGTCNTTRGRLSDTHGGVLNVLTGDIAVSSP